MDSVFRVCSGSLIYLPASLHYWQMSFSASLRLAGVSRFAVRDPGSFDFTGDLPILRNRGVLWKGLAQIAYHLIAMGTPD